MFYLIDSAVRKQVTGRGEKNTHIKKVSPHTHQRDGQGAGKENILMTSANTRINPRCGYACATTTLGAAGTEKEEAEK